MDYSSRLFPQIMRCAVGASFALAGVAAQAEVIYSNIPAQLPGNLPSLGYQATSTSEFGDHIEFAPGARSLNTVTVTMSNWALASTYGSNAPGYNQNLTFNIYNYTNNTAGALIASTTTNSLIPWRPEANSQCGGTAWLASGGGCYNGFAFNVTFDFSSLNLTLPDEIVFGLAFNTQSYGSNPTGQTGPYNSLNFALAGAPSVGVDSDSDSVFWNTSHQGFLTSGTAGVFGPDSAWSPYVPAVAFDATQVPEPASLALLGLGLVGLGFSRRKKA